MSSFAMEAWLQIQLHPIEAKLLRLALDPAAQVGEVATSAAKLINNLRMRGVLAADVFHSHAPASSMTDPELARALAMRMPFGKHKHKALRDVPLSYLRWVKGNCSNVSASLRDAILIILNE